MVKRGRERGTCLLASVSARGVGGLSILARGCQRVKALNREDVDDCGQHGG